MTPALINLPSVVSFCSPAAVPPRIVPPAALINVPIVA